MSKSCANCKHSKNIRTYQDVTQWLCEETPSNTFNFVGDYEKEFNTFYCSKWEDVFKKESECQNHIKKN